MQKGLTEVLKISKAQQGTERAGGRENKDQANKQSPRSLFPFHGYKISNLTNLSNLSKQEYFRFSANQIFRSKIQGGPGCPDIYRYSLL